MLVFLRVLIHLFRFSFRNITGKNADYRTPCSMHCQHDLRGLFTIHPEEALQYVNHEFHRRVVVVDQQHLEHRWTLELGFRGLDRESAFLVAIRVRSTFVRA